MTPHENRFRLALARATKTTQNANPGGYNGNGIGQRIDRHPSVAPSGRRAEPRVKLGRAVVLG